MQHVLLSMGWKSGTDTAAHDFPTGYVQRWYRLFPVIHTECAVDSPNVTDVILKSDRELLNP